MAWAALAACLEAQGLMPRGAATEIARVAASAGREPLPAWMELEDAGASGLWVELSDRGVATRVVLRRDGETTAITAPGACIGKPAAARLGGDRIALGLVCDDAGSESRRPRAFVLLLDEASSRRRWLAASAGADIAPEGDVDLAACSGELLVVWRDLDGHGDILGRFFDSTGRALTPVLAIVTAPAGGAPRVACGTARFVVAWGDQAGVWSQALGSDGSRLGGAARVSPSAEPGDREQPAVVAMNERDEAIVAWRARTGALYARLFRRDGAAAGPAFGISSTTRALGGELQAAMDSRGQFAIVWQVLEGGATATFGRIFTGERHLPVEAESRLDRGHDAGFVGVRAHGDGEFLVSWREAAPSGFAFAVRRLSVSPLAGVPRTLDEVRCQGRRSSLALAHLRPGAAVAGELALWPTAAGEQGIWYPRAERGARSAPAGRRFAVVAHDGDRRVLSVDGDAGTLRWIEPLGDEEAAGASARPRKGPWFDDCGTAPSAADAERAAWVAQRLLAVGPLGSVGPVGPGGDTALTGRSVYRGAGVDTFIAELFVLPARGGLGSVHVAAEVRLRCDRRGEPAAVEVRLFGESCSGSEHRFCSDPSAPYGFTWRDGAPQTSPRTSVLRPGRPEDSELSVEVSPSSAMSDDDTRFAEFCPATAPWARMLAE